MQELLNTLLKYSQNIQEEEKLEKKPSKGTSSQHLTTTDEVKNTTSSKSITDIIKEIQLLQKHHNQLTSQLVSEIASLEKENNSLHNQVSIL